MKIIAGMPAYNEGRYIGSLILHVRKYVDTVIVVDDGSNDNTSETARLAGAVICRHETRKGKGAAVKTIFNEARMRKADVLVLLDADYQHNPDEIPSVVKPILDGYDLSIGSRTAQADKTPRFRRLGQKVLLFLSHFVTKNNITDSESGFRALSKQAISEIQLTEDGFAVETEMLAKATERNLRITEVPISNIYTGDGSTLNPIRHGFGVFDRVLVMISERRPLLFFGMFGGLFMALGLAAGVMVVKSFYYSTGVLATGTALVAILFITVGLLTIFTGIILNVLVKRLSNKL